MAERSISLAVTSRHQECTRASSSCGSDVARASVDRGAKNRAIWGTALTSGSMLKWCTVLKLPPQGAAAPFAGSVNYGGKKKSSKRSLPPLSRQPPPTMSGDGEDASSGEGRVGDVKRVRTAAPPEAAASDEAPGQQRRAAVTKRAANGSPGSGDGSTTGGDEGEPRRRVRPRLTSPVALPDADEEAEPEASALNHQPT